MTWGSRIEIERRRRIKLLVWAYAYEFRAHSIVPDYVFDVEAMQVDLRIDTGKPEHDFWWRAYFKPFTGLWVHNHPDLDKIGEIYDRHYSSQKSQTIQ